jgi:hypothetical protein
VLVVDLAVEPVLRGGGEINTVVGGVIVARSVTCQDHKAILAPEEIVAGVLEPEDAAAVRGLRSEVGVRQLEVVPAHVVVVVADDPLALALAFPDVSALEALEGPLVVVVFAIVVG